MRYGTNYLSLALLRVLPGTDLVQIAKEQNLTLDTRDSSHYVYNTPNMPRSDLLECLRLNTVAFRLLSSIDLGNRITIRDLYFEVKDALGITNIQMLSYFKKEFDNYLTNTNYSKPDFPNAEDYSCKTIFKDITDEWLTNKLNALKTKGI